MTMVLLDPFFRFTLSVLLAGSPLADKNATFLPPSPLTRTFAYRGPLSPLRNLIRIVVRPSMLLWTPLKVTLPLSGPPIYPAASLLEHTEQSTLRALPPY